MSNQRIPKITHYHLLGATTEDIERVMNSLEPKAIKVLEGVEFIVTLDPFLGKDEVYIIRAPFGGMSRLSPPAAPEPQPPRHARLWASVRRFAAAVGVGALRRLRALWRAWRR